MANLITKRRIIFSGINYSRPAQEWFGVLSSQPSGVMKTIYDNYYFKPLVSSGIFDELDRFFEFGGEIEANGLISLKNPTATAAAKVGTTTWTQFQGTAGNGVDGYNNLNYIPSTNGVKLVQDSVGVGAYFRTNSAASSNDMGGEIATTGLVLVPKFTDNNIYQKVNDNTFTPGLAITRSDGLISLKRIDANNRESFRNGVSLGAQVRASVGLPSVSMYMGVRNLSGVATSFSTRQFSTCFMGSGNFSHLTMYNIMQAFRTQLQTQV